MIIHREKCNFPTLKRIEKSFVIFEGGQHLRIPALLWGKKVKSDEKDRTKRAFFG